VASWVEAGWGEPKGDRAGHAHLGQGPRPKGLDEYRVLERIAQAKDADGLHPLSLGKLALGEPTPLPCTPYGAVVLLRRFGVELNGAHVVVIGRGTTVGRPIGLILTRKSDNATVTLCHTGTRDLAAHTRQADVSGAAAGVPNLVTAEMVKPGAAVLDELRSSAWRPPTRTHRSGHWWPPPNRPSLPDQPCRPAPIRSATRPPRRRTCSGHTATRCEPTPLRSCRR